MSIHQVARNYAELTGWIADSTGTPDSLLHVHAGLAVMLLASLVSRKPLATPLPLLAVGLAAAGNELLDRLHHGSWRWEDSLTDFASTMFWPTVLMMGLRLSRLGAARPARRRTGR